MSILKLPIPGSDLRPELTITQAPIALGAGSTFANANNVCTLTFAAAHGLTFAPNAGVPPNFFVSFTGVTAETGVGELNGNVFRILAIPSTTTIQIYSTVTTATVTGASAIPVFIAPFTARPNSPWVGGDNNSTPYPDLEAAAILATLGANCAVQVNTDGTALLLDPLTTPVAGTPGAPTWRTKLAASTDGFSWLSPPSGIWANGAAGTSYVSVVN